MLIAVTEKVDIPDEPGEWMRFKSLSWGQRQQAREIAKTRGMDEAKRAVEMMRMLADEDADIEKQVDEARAKRDAKMDPDEDEAERDVLGMYDPATVVDYGIAEWSYKEAKTKPSEQLSPETVEWAARQIMERNTRPPSKSQDTGTS